MAVLLVALPLGYAAFVSGTAQTSTVRGGGERQAPSLTGMLSACTGLTRWTEAPADEIGYVPDTQEILWRISPPTSGNFSERPWSGERFVTLSEDEETRPTPGSALALNYRGWMTLWYSPEADAETLAAIERAAPVMLERYPKLLIAPWPLDVQTTWPKDRAVVFTGWNWTQSCGLFDMAVLDEFAGARTPAPGEQLPADAQAPRARVASADVLR